MTINREPAFADRHIGPSAGELSAMLEQLRLSSLEELAEKTVPRKIRLTRQLNLPAALDEASALNTAREIALENSPQRSYIGMGYYGTNTPLVILRNILENPGWYTQYTPYQAEIAQGRLEALLTFQTMCSDLTGMDIANASLLDEATAAAEAMTMCHRLRGSTSRSRFFVSAACHPQTIEVVHARALPLDIHVDVGDASAFSPSEQYFGVLVQYPETDGAVREWRALANEVHAKGALFVVAADLLSLALLQPPGRWGADVVVGNSQRFGVPMGGGGPHAAFFATRDEFKRMMPGRLAGVSKDRQGRSALRLSLQTREQHIRREKATSNICTAQVLLAIMAGMYAVYHGPKGLRAIAERVALRTRQLAAGLQEAGLRLRHKAFFDTLRIDLPVDLQRSALKRAEAAKINLRVYEDKSLGVSLDETVSEADLKDLLDVFGAKPAVPAASAIPSGLERPADFLTHAVFNEHHSETELLRYITRLQAKDLSLTTSMIPLGSCTMKLNATVEMIPVTWPEFAQIHPFAPAAQLKGYQRLTSELEAYLAEITGLAAVSLQPNAGSQGEYAGLLVIRAYHQANGNGNRRICLIPESAHGTNPASAVMAGYSVVGVKCDARGNVDLNDLREKAEKHASQLAVLMITYPSTHGVFEEGIIDICRAVHQHGGQVYMDGANMNAQVGLCRPGDFGVDVCHLNLHKTFCIPHGGGGPGVGPIAVAKHLAGFLPGHPALPAKAGTAIAPVSAAQWGSAAILPISYTYIRLMGADGLQRATEIAILNANYIASRLEPYYPVLYRGANGMVAHECILDFRALKRASGVEVEDVAKRLMDYGFHAPTVSFPVHDTLMVEPTESESKAELDRFCDSMIAIHGEIQEIIDGKADKTNNVLKNAPHPALVVCSSEWPYAYSREKAAYPAPWLTEHKFWPAVSRIDNVYGDRNLVCSCGIDE